MTPGDEDATRAAAVPAEDRPAYGSLTQPAARGGLVTDVEEGSPAARAGVAPGDLFLTADAFALHDVIDWQWIADGPRVDVVAERGRFRVSMTLRREPGERWGVAFASPVFDRVRTCSNDCAFCFMTQLPKGLRPSLYLRDDDYRLSFLSGTFITLTNLTDADVTRIVRQRLSPLHVSLHAVSPQVRGSLVRCRGEDVALARFDELAAAGIELHVQIVLVPGVNDGGELARTLGWLVGRGDGVASVGIVPLGWTGHQDRFSGSYEDPNAARAIIEYVRPWQEQASDQRGRAWVQLADEFYLAAGVQVPPAEAYDGYPQFENGIGMVRAFLDEWAEGVAEHGAEAAAVGAPAAVAEPAAPAVLVTGELFAPVLRNLVADLGPVGERIRVLPVPNRLFGGSVSVTGLLSGADIALAVAADAAAVRDGGELPPTYLVPDLVLNDDVVTLDDVSAEDLAPRAGAEVRVVSSDAAGLLEALGL